MKAYELGQYEKSMPNDLTWKEKLQLCREFGFDYLEMSVDESEEKLARLSYTQAERKIFFVQWRKPRYVFIPCV